MVKKKVAKPQIQRNGTQNYSNFLITIFLMELHYYYQLKKEKKENNNSNF